MFEQANGKYVDIKIPHPTLGLYPGNANPNGISLPPHALAAIYMYILEEHLPMAFSLIFSSSSEKTAPLTQVFALPYIYTTRHIWELKKINKSTEKNFN